MKSALRHSALILLLSTLLFPLSAVAAPPEDASISAECAILIEATTGRVLYAKNADKRHAMASTTKIMTALVAAESMPLDAVISVDPRAVGVEGSSVYLTAGQRYTLEALLHALLLQSANDAAEAIAYAIAGSVPAFAERMNERAATLGLTATHFENPHGLDGDTHFTTASELAFIAKEAMAHPALAEIFAKRRYIFASLEGENARTLINHNKMLVLYDGAVGVKTGYTKRCGRCLVSAAERDGLSLIAVTLDAPSDWSDHRALLDYGFLTYESRLLAAAGEIALTIPLFNAEGTATVVNSEEIRLSLPKDAPAPTVTYDLFPLPVTPVRDGALAGYVTYTAEDGTAITSPLIYTTEKKS